MTTSSHLGSGGNGADVDNGGNRKAIDDGGGRDAVLGIGRSQTGVVAVGGLRTTPLAAAAEVGQMLGDGAGGAVVAVAPAAVLLVAAGLGGAPVDATAVVQALAGLGAGEEGNSRKDDGGELHFDGGGGW